VYFIITVQRLPRGEALLRARLPARARSTQSTLTAHRAIGVNPFPLVSADAYRAYAGILGINNNKSTVGYRAHLV
jgi:hypothetical protein